MPERVCDGLLEGERRAGFLSVAPCGVAVAGSSRCEIIAFEAIIDPLVKARRWISQGSSSASQRRSDLVSALRGGERGQPREALAGGIAKSVLSAQLQLTAKRVAGLLEVA